MKALVMSGGGSHGSYGAGALSYLLGDLGINYNIITGISVGALNGAFLGMYKLGDEKQASEDILKLWLSINNSSIHKRWFPFGKIHALWKPSLLNSAPLQKLVRSSLDMNKVCSSGKQIIVSAVDIGSGEYKSFNQNYNDFPGAVLASSSFPGFLLPVKLDNEWYVDGGLKSFTPIVEALEAGATELDIIITFPENSPKVEFKKTPSTFKILTRSLQLMSDELGRNDLSEIDVFKSKNCSYNGKEIKVRIIRPNFEFDNNSLDFSPDAIRKMILTGSLDAREQYKL